MSNVREFVCYSGISRSVDYHPRPADLQILWNGLLFVLASTWSKGVGVNKKCYCFSLIVLYQVFGIGAISAAGIVPFDRFMYTESNGTITITGLSDRSDSSNTDVVIPELIDGKPVVMIGDYAFNDSHLTSIVLPDSVTTIGNGTFTTCADLETVVLGNSVTIIGKAAFALCGRLTAISLPDSLLNIEPAAFAYCLSLTSVIIPASVISIGNDVFLGCEELGAIQVDAGNRFFFSMDGVLFSKDKTALLRYPMRKTGDSYAIPGSVTRLGARAFENCRLVSVEIPDSIQVVEEEAFGHCVLLLSIEFPDSVLKIGDFVCFSCTALESVSISDTVSIIGDRAFDGCEQLTSVILGCSVEIIGESAFERCNSLGSIILPASVAFIGKEAFNNCRKLVSVTFLSVEPPILEDLSVFRFNAAGRQFHVPSGSAHAYKTAENWMEYVKDIAL